MTHFTERCRPGSVLAARASTRSAMPRCGGGRLAMYAKTGLSPTAAFAGLALPVTMDSGRVVAALPSAAVRLAGFRPASLDVFSSVLRAGIGVTCTVEVVGRPPWRFPGGHAAELARLGALSGARRFVRPLHT